MSTDTETQTQAPAENTPTAAPQPTSTDVAPGQAPVAVPEASKSAETPASPVEVTTDTDPVPAQVTGAAPEPVREVAVHETRVHTDRVITDPNDPLAVQVPEAGRGNALTPIAQTYADNPETPEAAIARKEREAADES
jgi:hypothetical protein